MSVNEFQILLIDDDEDDYVHIRSLFSEIPRQKFSVTWKSSYRDGLEALRHQKFDVCLLDYRLGEHTGIDLLKELQAQNLSCPIVFLTGHGDFDLDIQAMQMGASEYLVKDQLTPPLLERSVRYTMKHAHDMEELRESKAQILQQDRLASLGLLASSLAHEIGTPLGIIRSRAELVERRAGSQDQLKNDMATVITQIDRITKLVNSLLSLARGRQAEFASAVSLGQVTQDVLNLMQHELDRKNIALKVNLPEGVLVRAEPGPLGQVLLNLLVNSVHAIEEERLKGARKDNHMISVQVLTNQENVSIVVTDSGIGIPEKNRSQLFKPFFTTKDIGHGTGLGLATSFKLVDSWGGSISVESTEGVSTSFTVQLRKA